MGTSVSRALVERCDDVSAVLKSLSHPVRLKILCQIMNGEKSVNELTEFCQISQSGMSRFLQRMKDEGIVSARREQNFVYYSVANAKLVKLLKAIKEIYC